MGLKVQIVKEVLDQETTVHTIYY